MHQGSSQHQQSADKLITVEVRQLTVPMIDWLIARLEGEHVQFDGSDIRYAPDQFSEEAIYSPATDPSLGQPLMEREKLQVRYIDDPGHSHHGLWLAQDCRFGRTSQHVRWGEFGRSYADLELGYLSGPTMLIAAMRFLIAKHVCGKCLSPAVQVPAYLVEAAA